MADREVPVVTVDGPSGSGKGTVSVALARQWGWHLLDSGAIYRLVALKAISFGIAADAVPQLVELAQALEVVFIPELDEEGHIRVFLSGEEVTHAIRQESYGGFASTIAVYPALRQALLETQRVFKKAPGLIADGRDMGTVVFPEALLKVFLEASLEARANRRYKQLKKQGIDVTLSHLVAELQKRDQRDRSRTEAPLRPAKDALMIDTTNLTVSEVVALIQREYALRKQSL